MDMAMHVSREDYRRWAQAQPRGRFERVGGRVVRTPAEQMVHMRLKCRIWQALDAALAAAGIEGEACGDGATVEVGADTDYEPDCVINLGPDAAQTDMAVPNPVIVVEVLSPGTQAYDRTDKLAGYFRVPSIQHYLIVSGAWRQVTHHRRTADGIETSLVTGGLVTLDPPGLTIDLDAIYQRVGLPPS